MKSKNKIALLILIFVVVLVFLFLRGYLLKEKVLKNNIFNYDQKEIASIKYLSGSDWMKIKIKDMDNFLDVLKSVKLEEYNQKETLYGGFKFAIEFKNGDIKNLVVFSDKIYFDKQYYLTTNDICDELRIYCR